MTRALFILAFLALLSAVAADLVPEQEKRYKLSVVLKNPHDIVSAPPRTNVVMTIPAGTQGEIRDGENHFLAHVRGPLQLNIPVDTNRALCVFKFIPLPASELDFNSGAPIPLESSTNQRWAYWSQCATNWQAQNERFRNDFNAAVGFDPAVCCFAP